MDKKSPKKWKAILKNAFKVLSDNQVFPTYFLDLLFVLTYSGSWIYVTMVREFLWGYWDMVSAVAAFIAAGIQWGFRFSI